MGRQIACDHCNDTIPLDDAEHGWFRLTQEQNELEAWFCSIACVANWSAEDLEVTGEDIDDTPSLADA